MMHCFAHNTHQRTRQYTHLLAYEKTNKKIDGLSLLELLISLAIFSIVTTLSLPELSRLIAKNKVISHSNYILESLNVARSYAINHQKHVYLCAMTDTNTCNTKRNYNASWSNGWLVFVDENNDGELSNADNILHIADITSAVNVVFNQRGRLRYFFDGSARSAGFYICDRQQHFYQHVYLLHSGRARISQNISKRQKRICDNV